MNKKELVILLTAIVMAFVFGVVSGCQTSAIGSPSTTTTTQVAEELKVPITSEVYTPVKLEWEVNHPERIPWSVNLRSKIFLELTEFLQAKNWALYCTKFNFLSDNQKVDVIATVAVGMALYESSYNPKAVYHEPPPLNIDSLGLFQLSYTDGFKWCSLDKSKNSLLDPINNINCTIPELAMLMQKDSVVTSRVKPWKGGSRYWSTLRPPKLDSIMGKVRALPFCK